jgi:MFS family permease
VENVMSSQRFKPPRILPHLRLVDISQVRSADEIPKYRALPWSIAHVALNNFFYIWTFGGSVFLLFLSELGLPKDQIGLLLSLFPFAGLLALGTGERIARFGRKRTYLLGYGIRKPVMASLLLLPWMIARISTQFAVAYLYGVLIAVAILRALAETAYYPWLQEFVPNAVRGKYGAVNTVFTMFTSLIALWIASQVLTHNAGMGRFMTLIGLGSAIGLFAVGLMAYVPGGKPLTSAETEQSSASGFRKTLKDKNFTYFLAGMGSYTVGVYMLSSFLPLYLKENMGIESGIVVSLDMLSMLGGALASILSGLVADRVGSRPIMMPSLALSVFIPAGWLLVAPNLPSTQVMCGVLYFAFGAVANSASISAIRLLFNSVIPQEKNTPYTSLFYAWSGLMGGFTPLLAGKILSSLNQWQIGTGIWPIDAFRLLFITSIFGFTISVFFYAKVRPDGVYTTRSALRKLSRQIFHWRR